MTSPHGSRPLGSWGVHPIGLGCMNISHAYGVAPSLEDGDRVLLAAFDAGCTLFDTAALYGFGANETQVGRVLKPHRQRIMLTSKGGMAGEVDLADGKTKRVIDGRPEALRRHCEASLKRLQTDVIDLYYLHRLDPRVPIEESVGAMADLKREGKVRALGLSEVSAETLKRAHAEHPIKAVQSEYSLWTRNPEIAVLQACRELGVAFVAFSPLARGFLGGALRDVGALDAKDIRRAMPRFEAKTYDANLRLLPPFEAMAQAFGCTPAQLALAWLLAKGDHIIPIPGSTQVSHVLDNLKAVNVRLTNDEVAQLDALIHERNVQGGRYNAATQTEIDTETFSHEGGRA